MTRITPAVPALRSAFRNLDAWSVGFDRQWSLLEQLQESLLGGSPSYPPYNIKKTSDNGYQIEMAVAGFSRENLAVKVVDNRLIIEGTKKSEEEAEESNYIHRGIASRHFTISILLADYTNVNDTVLKDGILTISLERQVPEEKKPREIRIK